MDLHLLSIKELPSLEQIPVAPGDLRIPGSFPDQLFVQ